MNDYKLTDFFTSKDFRTIDTDARNNPVNRNTYIKTEIQLLEGSRLYDAFPEYLNGTPIIYGFINARPELDDRFVRTEKGNYGDRYIIIRESTIHMLILFVSDNEEKMNFLRFEKQEFFDLAKESLHPNLI